MEERTLKIDFVQLGMILELQRKVALYERAMRDIHILLLEKKYHPVSRYGDEFIHIDAVLDEILELYPREKKDV